MRISLRLIDPKIRRNLGRYVVQVGVATVALGLVLAADELVSGGSVTRGILFAAIASTAFILFIMPHSTAAQPRKALGGHLVALAVGATAALVITSDAGVNLLDDQGLLFAVEAAAAVGLSMFLMAATNTEHPPAAGTALAAVTKDITWDLALLFVGSVVGLVLVHWLLRDRMQNLY